MKNIVLVRKLSYNYKGIVFDLNQAKMVSDDCAEYLLSQEDDKGVPVFQETETAPTTTVESQTAEGDAALSYTDLLAKCEGLGIVIKGRPSRAIVEELLAGKDAELTPEDVTVDIDVAA